MRARASFGCSADFLLAALAVIPLKNMLSNSPVDAKSSPGFTPIMQIPPDVDKNHNGIADSLDQEMARATRAKLISSVL